MCGILGFTGPADKHRLEYALNLIKHRGPDSNGIFCDEFINLGHARLSIIDIALGSQPMHSQNNRYVIIFNGEIYNYQDLKAILASRGCTFKTNSDTEILLNWVIEFGTSRLSELNGMFAFALWDKVQKKLLVVRDRLGMKPLYYKLSNDNSLIFASEIKAIQGIDRAPEVNHKAIYQYLTFQNVLTSDTFFKGVYKLNPGSFLIFANGKIQFGSYWKPFFHSENDSYSDSWIAEKYISLLQSSINRHLISDVPVGSFLSGGIDSSLVSTFASKILNKPINTFTGFFTESHKYDERVGAHAVRDFIGSNGYDVEISENDFYENIETVMYHLEEPMLGTGALPQFMVAKFASQHNKVVLTGHGGDEAFAGYQVNRSVAIRESLQNMSFRNLAHLCRIPLSELSRVLYFLTYPILYPEVSHGLFIMTPKKNRSNIFTGDFLNLHFDYDPLSEIFSHYDINGTHSQSNRLTLLYLRTYLPTLFLQEDKVSMAHSIESRMPLCDNQLIDFSLSLSLAKKMLNGELKGIPRSASMPHLPKALYSLPKRGFPTPFARWFRKGKNAEFIADLVYSNKSNERGIVNAKYAKKIFEQNFKSKTDNLYDYARANQIYSIAMVELWHRIFIDEH